MTVCDCGCSTLGPNHDADARHPNPKACEHAEMPTGGVAYLASLTEDAVQDSQRIMRDKGFVIDMDLSKPIEALTEAERWQKFAFTLYTKICVLDSTARALHEEAGA